MTGKNTAVAGPLSDAITQGIFNEIDDRDDFQVFLDREVRRAKPKNKKEKDRLMQRILEEYAKWLQQKKRDKGEEK